jgi:EmrB/QacA subfamily drug resistance transporter
MNAQVQGKAGGQTQATAADSGKQAPVVAAGASGQAPADADGTGRGAGLPAGAWIVLGIVLIADIMDLLDSTITTIAAPTIAASLHGGPGLIKWLGASYALALGVLLVTGGRLGDKYGRRRTFLIGIAGFTLASLACGLAWDPASIIVARLVQGAFGAVLIPQGFGILGAVFPREHIGKAFSAFGPVLGLSAVGGPLLAGVLIDANLFGLGWRPMFLINIVLGAAGLAAALRLLPRDAGDRSVSIDVLGSALLAACMLGLLFGLIQGSTDGWGAGPIAALAAGAVFFAAFCQRQRTAAAPLIKPSLLRNRGFTAGLILGLVVFATVGGLIYAVSLFLQRGLGYSPEHAAVTGFAPAAAGIVIAAVACMNLLARLGRTLSLIGIVVTVTGVAVLLAIVAHAGTAASAAELAPAMFVVGLGMGATFSTIYDIAIGDIDPDEAGSASGSLSSIQQLANAVGPAVITTIYFGALAGGQAHAVTVSLITVIAIGAASCLVIPLLPRRAQPGGPH